MSEWKTAKELAEDLGCSMSAVFTAASKKHRLRKHLIEKQKRGSSAFFRVVPEVLSYEPAGLKNGVWEPTRTKTHGELNRIPKPPLTIVQEEPSGIDQDVWARFEKLEKLVGEIPGALKRGGEFRDHVEGRLRALEHNSHTQRERILTLEKHTPQTFENLRDQMDRVESRSFQEAEGMKMRIDNLTELVMSLHREVIKTTPAETVGRLGRAMGAFADALKGAK